MEVFFNVLSFLQPLNVWGLTGSFGALGTFLIGTNEKIR